MASSLGQLNLTLRVTQPIELRLAVGPAFRVPLLAIRVLLLAIQAPMDGHDLVVDFA